MIFPKIKAAAFSVMIFVAADSITQSQENAVFEMARSQFNDGYMMFNNMNYLAAAEFFRKALSTYPEYHCAREYLARCYRLAGYTDEAISEWEKLEDTEEIPSVKNKIDVLKYFSVADYQEKSFVDEFTFIKTIKSGETIAHRFPYPVDITVDDEKNFYVTSFSTGRIVKFDINANPVDYYTSQASGKIYGIDYRNNRFAYADFSKDTVFITDKKMKPVYTISGSGSGENQFHGPEGLVFDDEDNLFVVDNGNNRVCKFSRDGKFILSFGKAGEYEGELNSPTDVALIGNNVYITDTDNNRIAVFDKFGNWLNNITIEGLENPKGLTTYRDSLVISDNRAGIVFYNPQSGEKFTMKDFNEDESFVRANAAVFDREGILYSLDHARQAIDMLIPLKKHYSNLDVEITSVDVKKFPVVALYVSVRNRDGSPVYSLKKENFSIREDKAGISSFYVDYFKDLNPKVSSVFCIDRSEASSPYRAELLWLSDYFLRKMHKDDRLKIVNFSTDCSVANDFDWSRLRALKSIKTGNYSGFEKNTGKALYNAIDDVISSQARRAVVLVTDGSVNENSFETYSVSNIINYARNHFVPIHVIYFREADEILARIAKSTGGSIMKANQADSIKNLYDSVKNQEEYRYALIYSSYKSKEKFGNWWSDVSIDIDVNGQSGTEWGGYYVPKR